MGGIRIVQLEKRYSDRVVLEDVSLEVKPGCLYALLGESGSGKTTLIRSIAGLTPIDGGRLEIAGRDAGSRWGIPAEERNVGVVFQDLALWPHMRVWENVAFPLEETVPRLKRERRARETLDRVRLPVGHDRYPHEISGGERRRVALARALVREPEALLLDEPFSDLNVTLRDELMALVWDFAKDRQAAVIHATHVREEALAFADRLGILARGRIMQEGTPEEVYRRPVTPLAARLLGEIAVLRGERVAPTTVRTSVGDITSPGDSVRPLLGVRPEALRVDDAGRLRGRVRRTRFLGGRTLYEVDLGGDLLWATGATGRQIGEEVGLHLDPEGVCTFPETNGDGDE